MGDQGGNRRDRNGSWEGQRKGAGRRTYPMEGNGPRVGRIAPDVPRAERVGASGKERNPYGGNREAMGRPYGAHARREDGRDERKSYGGNRETAGRPYGPERREERPVQKRPYGAERYYDGDPKRRNAHAVKPDMPKAEPVPEAAVEPAELEHMLCGRNPIREALRAGRPVEKLLAATGDLSGAAREIIQMARDAGVVVQMVDRSRLDQIYPAHQGLLAYVAAVPYSTVDEMLETAKERGEDPFLILLDGITDPHNLGAIIRSAECVGAHGVVIPERRAVGLTPAAAKAAAGALNHMKIARVTNLNRTIDELKAQGVWIIGTSMGGQSAFEANLSGPVALVIGSEGDGISRLTLEKCDLQVTLPMKGHIESLNASVAAGVMMYEIARARAK